MAITVQTQVTQLYVALFMRAPDAEGLAYWVGEVGAKTLAQVAQDMYNTAPARTYYPDGATDTEVITSFYSNVLGRAPDADGLSYWVGELAKDGATKGSVIATMISSVVAWTPSGDSALDALAEISQNLFNNKTVVAEYYADIMDGGIAGATDALNAVTATSDVSTPAAIEALIADGAPVYTLTAGAASVNEGASATFDLATLNVPDGTVVAYTVSGVSAADLTSGLLTGTTTVLTGKASITIPVKADGLTEGAETLTVKINGSTATASTTVNDTSLTPIAGKNTTLTIQADTFAGGGGADTINGSSSNTLTANDVLIDETVGDGDVLNATINVADVKATVKGIESFNVTWTGNSVIALDATNMAANTFVLKATGIAYPGTATITALGSNNVKAGSTVTSTLTLTDVVNSTIDTGSATKLVINKGDAVDVALKTSADITINNDISIVNTKTDQVENLVLTASKAATVVLGDTDTPPVVGDGIDLKLTVAGSQNVTVKGDVTGDEIVNAMTAGSLTITATDEGDLDLSKVSATLVNIAAAATTVTVGHDMHLAVAGDGELTSLVGEASLTGVTTALTTSVDIATLDVTLIDNLNLEVTKNITVTGLITDDTNNVVISGSGNLILASKAGGVAAIDASALKGTFDYTSSGNETAGIIGSATAKNTFDLTSANGKVVTAIGGAAIDTFTVAASAGTLKISGAGGDDVIQLDGALTGTAVLDGGANSDTVKVIVAAGVADITTGASKVSFVGVEKIAVELDNTAFNNVQLSGQTFNMSTTGASGSLNINVFAYDKTGLATTATTDLSSLVFGTTVDADISTVAIAGLDGAVDTIKGTKLEDLINAGKKGDIINITQGGTDSIAIDTSDSTWTITANNMDQITGFNAVVTATAFDTLLFADYAQVAADAADVDVSASVVGETVTTGVLATVADGFLTIAGTNAGKIDTLREWISVSAAALTTGVNGDAVAFTFAGSTYVTCFTTYDADHTQAAFDIVQLVGTTNISALDETAAANTIVIGTLA